MSSDFYSRDEEVARGSIPLDIDNVHMLLQGQSASRVDLLMLRYESCSQGGASELLFESGGFPESGGSVNMHVFMRYAGAAGTCVTTFEQCYLR